MKEYLKKHHLYLLVLTIIGIAVMLIAGWDTTHLGHDMQFHVPNIRSLAESLDIFKGKIGAPAITEIDGIGYGLYLFYPPLPHLLYAYGYKLLSLFSISLLNSVLFMHIFLTVLSTYLLYHLSYKISKSSKTAFFSGLIFLFFPYRLSNYFIRYAINESLSFVFIPLILLGLYYLKEKQMKPFMFCFVIGYIGLLYTHLVIAFYFTLLLILFAIFYRKVLFAKETWKHILASVLLVTICFLPFLVSLIEHASLPYLVYKEGYMTSAGLLEANALSILDYVLPSVSDWGVTYYIPVVTLLLSFLSAFTLFLRRKDTSLTFYKVLFWISLLSIIINLSFIPWKALPSIFLMIQFPWRLETILVITLSLFAPLCIREFPFKYTAFVIAVGLILTQTSYLFFLQNRSYHITEQEITNKYQTGNLHEYYLSSYLGKEDYYAQRGNALLIESGEADITVQKSSFPSFRFTVNQATRGAEVEFPRIYYLGYDLKKDGQSVPYFVSKQGFIKSPIEEGTYELVYQGTFLQRTAFIISRFSIIILVLCSLFKFVKKRQSLYL